MADLKGQAIRDAYDQLLTKGSANSVEDGDGIGFDISGANISGQTLQTALDGKAGFETGTFALTLETSGTDFDSISYDRRNCRYTKIGNLVHIQGAFRTSEITKGSASGEIRFGNLPFLPAPNSSDLNGHSTGSVTDIEGWETNPTHLLIRQSGIDLKKRASTTSAILAMTVDDVSYGTGSRNEIRIGVQYITDE